MTDKAATNAVTTEVAAPTSPATPVTADEKSMQNMTNNQATAAQKAADKNDAYIRS